MTPEELAALISRKAAIAADVLDERARQIEKGYDSTHDDSVGPSLLIQWATERLQDAQSLGELRKGAIEAAAMLCAVAELVDRWSDE